MIIETILKKYRDQIIHEVKDAVNLSTAAQKHDLNLTSVDS